MTSKHSFINTLLAATLLSANALVAANAADLTVVPSGTYEVDATHAYINFQYNHLGLSNPTLSFDDFTVDLELDNADPTKSTINVTIDTSSVITGSDIWKEHLTSADWFDVDSHPTIVFQSTGIEAAGDGAYMVTGDLTVKGESKPVTLNVAINAAMDHPMSGTPVIGLDGSGGVLRSDFGLGKWAPNISDEISLNFSVEMLKAGE